MRLSGRTVVVYDARGAPIACSGLALVVAPHHPYDPTVSEWHRYPGYAGVLEVRGSVRIFPLRAAGVPGQILFVALDSADPGCGTADLRGIPNACGVHVHAGASTGICFPGGSGMWKACL